MQSALSSPHFHNEDAAFTYLEARIWLAGLVCYHCGVIGRAGKLNIHPGLYNYYACRKQFTIRMGTVFEGSHVPLRCWLKIIYIMCSSKMGIGTRQVQRTLD